MTTSQTASRLDCWTLDVFLSRIMGWESGGSVGRRWTDWTDGRESNSPTASNPVTGPRNRSKEAGYAQSLTVQPETSREDSGPDGLSLADVVQAIADDLRALRRLGYSVPYGPGDLYVFVGRIIDERGVDAAEAWALDRYRVHVAAAGVADLPPLVVQGRGAP